MSIRLARLSAITSAMSPEEAKLWEAAVEEAAPVLNTIRKHLERKLADTDANMSIDAVLKQGSDVTITLLALQSKKDAINVLLDLFKNAD